MSRRKPFVCTHSVYPSHWTGVKPCGACSAPMPHADHTVDTVLAPLNAFSVPAAANAWRKKRDDDQLDRSVPHKVAFVVALVDGSSTVHATMPAASKAFVAAGARAVSIIHRVWTSRTKGTPRDTVLTGSVAA